jgi:hypothetical protein
MILLTALQIIIAILLFYAINWLGKHSTAFGYKRLSLLLEADEAPAFNLLFRILTPVVFLLILSAAFYAVHADFLNQDLYRVVIYYFTFRFSYNILLGRARLLNWPMQSCYLLVTTGLAYAAQLYLISQKSFFFPTVATLGNQLWLLIIVFIYLLFNTLRTSQAATQRRKNAYLSHRYQLYNKRYGQTVSTAIDNPTLEALVYSVMIYEAFNRPRAFRLLESVAFFVGRSKTLGIMQITTKRYISDSESVVLACNKITSDARSANEDLEKKDYSVYTSLTPDNLRDLKEQDLINEILKRYNGGSLYQSQVLGIFRQIKSQYYPKAAKLIPVAK